MKSRTILITFLIAITAGIIIFYARKKPGMPDITFTSITNQTLHSNDLRNKVVLVNFWATSCPGCIHEMPELIETYQRFNQQGFEIIAVAMQYDPPDYVFNYVKENKLPFFVTLDTQGQFAKAFGDVSLTPTSFLINQRGEVIQHILGEPNFPVLNTLIDRTLKEID